MEELKRFPLGENVYAYVQTRKGCTHIHIRHFVMPTDTKGGRGGVVASVKGVKMDLKMLNRLCKVKKNISDEFKIQESLKMKKKKNKNKKRKPSSSSPPPSSSPDQIIRQRRTDLPSLPFPLPSTDFPHDPQCVCHRLSGLTPKYPVAPTTTTELPSTATPTATPTTPPPSNTTTTTTTLPSLLPSLSLLPTTAMNEFGYPQR